jgi:hypothetical protein
MDCKTARLLLEFARPRHHELDAGDLRSLEDHVAACPECALASREEKQLDEHFGKAMRGVEVPDRLRSRIMGRLAEERAKVASRRWRRLVAAPLAAAAMLLLAIGAWGYYTHATQPVLNPEAVSEKIASDLRSPPNREAIEQRFREQGVKMVAPKSFEYSFLKSHGMVELEGRQVPCLVFAKDDHNAKVYVLSDRQFNLKLVSDNYEYQGSGISQRIEIIREPGTPNYAYLIVHTDDDLVWLKASPDTSAE